MKTCPNCGKMAGLHGSVLQGCMCQYSMQAVPQHKPWSVLTYDEQEEIVSASHSIRDAITKTQIKLQEKNT